MQLYHFPISPNSRRVVAVLHHLNLACTLKAVDLLKGEQFHDELVKLNPNHMIPILVDGDFVLWESNAIMHYLCTTVPSTSLFPADPKVRADITRWQFWQAGHFGRACGVFIFENIIKQALNKGEADSTELAKGAAMFHTFARVLESHLQGRDWLVGDGPTLADFSVGSFLDLAEAAAYPIAGYAEIQRWYDAIVQLPCWQSSQPSKIA